VAVPVGVELAEPYVELSYVDAVRECRRRPLLDCVTARFWNVTKFPISSVSFPAQAFGPESSRTCIATEAALSSFRILVP
jgi:hypothetical protein